MVTLSDVAAKGIVKRMWAAGWADPKVEMKDDPAGQILQMTGEFRGEPYEMTICAPPEMSQEVFDRMVAMATDSAGRHPREKA